MIFIIRRTFKLSIVVDCNISSDIENRLKAMNIEYFKSFNIDYMYYPVITHPDMQIHFIEDSCAIVAPIAFEYYKNTLPKKLKLIKGEKDPGGKYPDDCAYNVAKIGRFVIGNLAYVDKKIIEFYSSNGYELVNVKQGYAKCNLCIVNETSAITEDVGIFKTLSEKQIDVLKIRHSCVDLPSFEHGFIGGASGFISPNLLAFYGNLKMHPDYIKIYDFLKVRNVDIINLSSTKLVDYGSMLFF